MSGQIMTKDFPHFVLAGAPKSGTTSLHRYLAQHPSVFFPPGKKEPLFFCGYKASFTGPGSASLNRNMVTNHREYEALYSAAEPGMTTGDASTDYLACPEAPGNIMSWNPDARIIILLRNPVKRAYSEHMHLVRDRLEQHSFMASLELESERRRQGYIPLFRHLERGLYHEGVTRYLSAFGPDRVKILLHEDFTLSPQDTVDDVLRFIGLEPIRVDVADRYNVSGVPRWPWLQSMFVRFRHSDDNGIAKRIVRSVTNKRFRQAIRKFYMSHSLSTADGPTPEELRYLREYYADDVRRLGILLNRDLDHWLSPDGGRT